MKSQKPQSRPVQRRVRFVMRQTTPVAPAPVVAAARSGGRRILPVAGVSGVLLVAAASLFFGFTGRKKALNIQADLTNLPFQSFAISATEDAVVNGENGLILAIPAGAFVDDLGNTVQGGCDVTVRIKEANTMKDILKGNLATRTGEGYLATDGMYYLEASQCGKQLKLNPAVGIYAYFPTMKKDGAMGLYAGEAQGRGLNWNLLGNKENAIPKCDRDEESRKHCRKCEKLVKMSKKIKVTKAPTSYDQYFEDRYYWQNGKLYFASSGSAKPLFSEEDLKDCDEYLRATEKGQELLAKVETIQQNQLAKAQDYYAYRLQGMGWYNIDKLVKDELITFKGKVTDPKGHLLPGAQVHLLCTSTTSKIHTTDVAEDGTFELQFAPGLEFKLYVYQGSRAGSKKLTLNKDQTEVGSIAVQDVDIKQLDQMLADVEK